MIPKFPEFKTLEITDREEIITYTSKFLPYSDFNFTSMWSWDIDGKIMVSDLNGNLVVNFSDYVTSEPFYSLIGSSNIEQATQLLIDLSREKKVRTQLKLIPEEVAVVASAANGLVVEEDRDNFDYIFSTESLATMSGAKLKSETIFLLKARLESEK